MHIVDLNIFEYLFKKNKYQNMSYLALNFNINQIN